VSEFTKIIDWNYTPGRLKGKLPDYSEAQIRMECKYINWNTTTNSFSSLNQTLCSGLAGQF